MVGFCGDDGLWPPVDYDLTPCFQALFIEGVTPLVFIGLFLIHITKVKQIPLPRNEDVPPPNFMLLAFSIILALFSFMRIATAASQGSLSIAVILVVVVQGIAWLVSGAVTISDHNRLIPCTWVARLFWVLEWIIQIKVAESHVVYIIVEKQVLVSSVLAFVNMIFRTVMLYYARHPYTELSRELIEGLPTNSFHANINSGVHNDLSEPLYGEYDVHYDQSTRDSGIKLNRNSGVASRAPKHRTTSSALWSRFLEFDPAESPPSSSSALSHLTAHDNRSPSSHTGRIGAYSPGNNSSMNDSLDTSIMSSEYDDGHDSHPLAGVTLEVHNVEIVTINKKQVSKYGITVNLYDEDGVNSGQPIVLWRSYIQFKNLHKNLQQSAKQHGLGRPPKLPEERTQSSQASELTRKRLQTYLQASCLHPEYWDDLLLFLPVSNTHSSSSLSSASAEILSSSPREASTMIDYGADGKRQYGNSNKSSKSESTEMVKNKDRRRPGELKKQMTLAELNLGRVLGLSVNGWAVWAAGGDGDHDQQDQLQWESTHNNNNNNNNNNNYNIKKESNLLIQSGSVSSAADLSSSLKDTNSIKDEINQENSLFKQLANCMQKELDLRQCPADKQSGGAILKACFDGKSAVDWLLKSGDADNETEAVRLCSALLSVGCFRPVSKDKDSTFSNSDRSLYSFDNLDNSGDHKRRGPQFFVTYQIEIKSESGPYTIHKRFDQVIGLREELLELFPSLPIPKLSIKKRDAQDERSLQQKRRNIELFLQELVNSSSFSCSQLDSFLAREDNAVSAPVSIGIDPNTSSAAGSSTKKSEISRSIGHLSPSPLSSSLQRPSLRSTPAGLADTAVRLVATKENKNSNLSAHRFSVTIPEWCYSDPDDTSSFIQFLIHVRQYFSLDGYQAWTIKRRYSEFAKLHAQIRKRFPDVDLPGLPPKSNSFLRGQSKEFLDSRRQGLELFLQEIINTTQYQVEELHFFIDLTNPKRKIELVAGTA